MSDLRLRLVDEADTARVAAVMGPMSAASRALTELKRRRVRGEEVFIWSDDRNPRLLVGPAPPTQSTRETSDEQ